MMRPPSRRFLAIAALLLGAELTYVLWPEHGPDSTYNDQTAEVMVATMDPGSNGVDVGAFEGTLTAPMVAAAPRGHHYAVEPQPEYAAQLATRFPQVTVLPIALSDSDGTMTFVQALDDPARSGFREQDYPTANERTRRIPVRVARMDDVIPDSVRIRFIKIDVEGAEYAVLRGARATIRRGQPAIVFEYGHVGQKDYHVTPEMMWTLLHDELGMQLSLMRNWLDGGPDMTRYSFIQTARHGNEWMYIAHPPGMLPRPPR